MELQIKSLEKKVNIQVKIYDEDKQGEFSQNNKRPIWANEREGNR